MVNVQLVDEYSLFNEGINLPVELKKTLMGGSFKLQIIQLSIILCFDRLNKIIIYKAYFKVIIKLC